MNGESTDMVWPTLGSRTAKNMSSSVAMGAWGHLPPPNASLAGSWELPKSEEKKIGGWVGVPDHFGQTTLCLKKNKTPNSCP